MEKSPKVVEIYLDDKGQLVIPARLRQSLGFEDGDQLIVHEEGGQLILEKLETITQRLKSRFANASKVEDHKLEAVIGMPSGVFKPYAGVSTAVVIFTKTNAGGRDQVWFYKMEADGLSLDDKRQPVEENDIPDIIKRWQNRDRAKGKEKFSSKLVITMQDYPLMIWLARSRF